jgi:rare lipoprotein A
MEKIQQLTWILKRQENKQQMDYTKLRQWTIIIIFLGAGCLFLLSCGIISKIYKVSKGTIKTAYKVTKGTAKTTIGAGEIVYKVGGFTFKVVMAPLSWPLTHEEIETIDGLPPKEAIRQGRVKNSPYVVNGKIYVPMSVELARNYREKGIASWYGHETLRKKGGRMTANGEAFDPNGLSAAHKYLPLPIYVRVTNLQNHQSIIVRVNDRGPFVSGRIIDLSAGAARKLGFYKKGTAQILVECVEVKG